MENNKTMKFKSFEDLQMFLIDIGKLDEVFTLDEKFAPAEEDINEFIKFRGKMVGKLKDFRKSQDQKSNWRKYRSNYMKGIRDFHKSTAGKKMHRNLARFLTTRIKNESLELNIYELRETLQSFSSYPTHLFIEMGYYKPLEDQLFYEEFIEEAIPAFHRAIDELYSAKFELSEQDLDLILRVVDPDAFVEAIVESENLDKQKVKEILELKFKEAEEKRECSFLEIYKIDNFVTKI